mmetsp:Transcript_153880/g.271654  ORF Transcript_153880/g.271654 Transcript_153880/m.271654 type:complete len:266 (+) Transcript_153880:1188-1985(+)
MALVSHGDVRGKRSQILRAGQLWKQTLWVHVHPLPQRSGHEVEVQAALEALDDEAREGWHLSQCFVLLRHVAYCSVLFVLLLPLLFLLLSPEIFCRRIVRLCMSWQRRLRRWKRWRPLATLWIVISPKIPCLGSRWWWWQDLALAEKCNKLFHPHSLPLRRQESTLRWVGTAHRMYGCVLILKLHHLCHVCACAWSQPAPNASNDLKVSVCEDYLSLILMILDRSPSIWVIFAFKQSVYLAASEGPHDLFSFQVVTYMVLIFVPF